MQSNIGVLDRYVRLVSGFILVGSGAAMRRRTPLAKAALFSLGAMKIAEGVTGFCPLVYVADLAKRSGEQTNGQSRMNQGAESQNPTQMSSDTSSRATPPQMASDASSQSSDSQPRTDGHRARRIMNQSNQNRRPNPDDSRAESEEQFSSEASDHGSEAYH